MTDLTLQEFKPADREKLDHLLRQEVSQMFGPPPSRVAPVARQDRKPTIQKGFLSCLSPFRRLFRTS